MFHSTLSVVMVLGCVWAAVAHRRGTASEGGHVALADVLMLLMCLAMVDLAAGMIWPNETGTYLVPLWVWGAVLMVSAPAMALGHRVLTVKSSRVEQFLVMHRGSSMAAMAILVFLAHGTHDHAGSSAGHSGHDHSGPLRTVLAAGFGVGVLAYLGLSVALVLLLSAYWRRARDLPEVLQVQLYPQETNPDGGAAVLTRQARTLSPACCGIRSLAHGPLTRAWPAQLHEVIAQSIAVMAMLAMML